MKLRELKDWESFYAMQAVHKLLFGLKMLPTYMSLSYEEFFASLDSMEPKDQETILREAVVFVRLEPEELADILCFAVDPNGVPYQKNNSKNLKPEEIHEIIVAVSMEILRAHKVRLVTEKEKKNLKTSQSTSDQSLQDIPQSNSPMQ